MRSLRLTLLKSPLAGLVPATHVLKGSRARKTWVPGTRPGTGVWGVGGQNGRVEVAVSETAAIAPHPGRPAPWRDPRLRGIALQIVFVAVIAGIIGFLAYNTTVNLRRQNI